MSKQKGRVALLREIVRVIRRDLDLVKQNRAPAYTNVRIQRALGDKPWLIDRYEDAKGVLHKLPELTSKITWPELQLRFLISESRLQANAYRARRLGMHYDDFQVGSAGLFYDDNCAFEDAWKVTTGMNTKHARNMRPTCSEPITINAAFSQGYTRMVGMHVAGQLRTEDVGVLKTLHPCHDCRWFLHDHPIVFPQSMISMSYPPGHADYGTTERFKVSELLAYHREHSQDDFDAK